MSNADISVELQSMEEAVGKLTTEAVEKIEKLSTDWTHYLGDLRFNEWSGEEVCLQFSQTYVAAIAAYDQVMQGMKADITRYRDELKKTHDLYVGKDDSVMQTMNNHLAALSATSEADRMGNIALTQRTVLTYEGSTPAAPPPDTSPGEDGDKPAGAS